jgi:TRAP-type transport system small permease protein
MTSSVKGPAPGAGPALMMLRDLVRRIDWVSYGIVVFVMAAMAILVSTQVFARYVLSSSIDWAEEVARLAFVWAMFLAIPHGIKVGIHVGIDILVRQLNRDLQEIIFRVMAVFSAVLMILVFYVAIFVVADKWQELMPTVDITSAVYYIAVLISAGHSFLHLVLLAWGGSRVWEAEAS